MLGLLGGDGAFELFVFIRPYIPKAEILKLALDGAHAEAVGQRCVDLQRFFGLADTLFLTAVFQRAHVVQPVRELDDDHPHILGDGQEHLAQVLRLGFLLRYQLVLARFCKLGNAIHHLGNIRAENGGQLLHVVVAILDHIVQKPGDHRMAIHPHFQQHDGHPLGVDEIGLAALPLLLGMGGFSDLDGLMQKLHLGRGEFGGAGRGQLLPCGGALHRGDGCN